MNTDQLLTHAKERFEHAASKRLLKEKYEAKMIFSHAGGMWRAGPELQVLLTSTTSDTVVLLDLYENPIKVSVSELLELNHQRWQEQMNAWLNEFEKLSKNR